MLTAFETYVNIVLETRKKTNQEENKMTTAEKKAKKSYEQDLIKQGVDKETAEVMAMVFVEYGIIKPVVGQK